MEAILRAARDVGRMIAEHERTVAFKKTAQAVNADPAAQKVLAEFQSVLQAIGAKQQAGRPIEPNEKRRAAELQSEVASNDKLKDMLRTQADYVQLMQTVYAAIEESVDGGGSSAAQPPQK